MNEQQIQQQIILLVQAAMSGDQQATLYIQQVMQAAQQGDQQATQLAQMIQAVAQQLQGQQVQAAKFGAKLNYIRQLRGACPEGYEIEYFRNGGKSCKRCIAKQKMEEGGEVPSNPVDAFKCGRKMNKKKVKKARDGEKVTVVNTPRGKYKEYDRGEYFDYVTPTDSVSENIDGRDNEAVKRLNKAGLEFNEAKAQYGVQNEKNNKVSKHFTGGGFIRPFTGFEGFSYKYHAPRPSNQGRADRPERELIYNNGNYVMDRERYYDADLYEDSKQLQPIEDFIYSTYESPEGIDHTPIDVRTFNSLKRHALMNKSLISPKFANGSKINKAGGGLKTPYKSTIGTGSFRGSGSYASHKIYPTEDDYNNNRYFERRYYRNDFGDDNYYYDVNPFNLPVDYNTLDFSKTESSSGVRNSGNKYGYYYGSSSKQLGPNEYLDLLINGDEIYNMYDPGLNKNRYNSMLEKSTYFENI